MSQTNPTGGARSESCELMNLFMLSAVVVISLSSGMVAYRIALSRLLHRPFRYSEWSLYGPLYIVFGITVILVYLPFFGWLRGRLNGTRPLLVFPLAGALLSIVPISGLRMSGDARLADALSPEARVIYSMFVTTGFVFGLLYPVLCEGDENQR